MERVCWTGRAGDRGNQSSRESWLACSIALNLFRVSLRSALEAVRNRFVTGDWSKGGVADRLDDDDDDDDDEGYGGGGGMPEGVDDEEVYGDFEDLEEGAQEDGDEGGGDDDDEDGDDDNDDDDGDGGEKLSAEDEQTKQRVQNAIQKTMHKLRYRQL